MNCWEEKFENLLQEYSILSADHNQLKQSMDRLKKYCRYLEEENLQLRRLLNNYKSCKTVSKGGDVSLSLKELKIPKTLQTKPARYISENSPDMPAKALTPMKTPQPTPDNGVESEVPSSLYEAFFVIGTKPTPDISKPEASILFEYPASNSISQAMKNIMPGLALPHPFIKELKLTGSASDLNNLIFGQIPSKRNENCFIFTLRCEKIDLDVDLGIPNCDHEVVYFTCLLIEDIFESNGSEYIINKSYCLASFVPVFELHYETLCSILFLKRLHRMDLMQVIGVGEITPKLSNIEITQEGIELLQELGKVSYFEEKVEICLKTNSMDCLKYIVPQDLQFIDVPWLCIPLFSSLPVNDLCWLVSAMVQEKSIIFISSNIGLLTSCVLGLRTLIRPLHWMNLIVPFIPETMRELIEAPVPILAGINHVDAKTRYKYSNIIWVLLDENDPKHKIQVSRNFDLEIVELNDSLVEQVEQNYNFVQRNVFEMTNEMQIAAVKVAQLFFKYWRHVLGKFGGQSIKHKKQVRKVVGKFPECEQKFVSVLVNTQVFANSVDNQR